MVLSSVLILHAALWRLKDLTFDLKIKKITELHTRVKDIIFTVVAHHLPASFQTLGFNLDTIENEYFSIHI